MSSNNRGVRIAPVSWFLPEPRIVLIVFSITFALLVLSPTGAGAAETGSISGTLTDSAGDPLTESCIEAYDEAGDTKGGARTDSNGEYTMDTMQAGDYRVEFRGCSDGEDDVAPEFYDNEGSLAEAATVTVVSGLDTPGINAQLAPGGSVSGTVTDSADAPVNQGCVYAYDSSGDEVGFAWTDSEGKYSLSRLRAGELRLQFRGCTFNNLAGEFYANKQTLDQATPVPIVAGVETSGIDAQLQKPGGTISGVVTDSSGNPVRNIEVTAYDESGMEVERDGTDSEGLYTVKGLATGEYRLEYEVYPSSANLLGEFYDNADTLAEATPVSVTVGTDTPNIDVELSRGGSISGSFAGNFGASGSFGDIVCLFSVTAYDSNGEYVDSDDFIFGGNTFKIDKLETGDYRLRFSGGCAQISSGAIVTPVGSSYAEYFDDADTLEEATPVVVTAGSDTGGIYAHLGPGEAPPLGSISGQTTDSTGASIPSVCVDAFDSNGNLAGSSSMTNGKYKVSGLAAGDYRLRFSRCSDFVDNVLTEFFLDQEKLATATTVSVTSGADTPNIDAELTRAGSIEGRVTDSLGRPLELICVRAFNSDGFQIGNDKSDRKGNYVLGGLSTDAYRVEFRGCSVPNGNVIGEFYEDEVTLADAKPITATEGAATTGIDAELALTSEVTPPGDPLDPGATIFKAAIGKVSIKGPANVKKGKRATFRVRIANAGNIAATGVRLKVRGKGVSSIVSTRLIPAGTTRTVKMKLRPSRAGKTRLTFKVTSANAGSNSALKGIFVR